MAKHSFSDAGRPFSYQELWEKYQTAFDDISYYKDRIRELDDEVHEWCRAYEELSDELETYKPWGC